MPGSLSLIMPDGRIVALSDTAINMISDMSSLEEVEENKTHTETGVSLVRDDDLKFENFLEEVLCYKCKVCSHLGESRAEILNHIRENHSSECRNIRNIIPQEEDGGEAVEAAGERDGEAEEAGEDEARDRGAARGGEGL